MKIMRRRAIPWSRFVVAAVATVARTRAEPFTGGPLLVSLSREAASAERGLGIVGSELSAVTFVEGEA